MNKIFILVALLLSNFIYAQDYSKSPWHIQAENINPQNYYGITLANGMVGLVSSPNPMKVSSVVLNGVYDNYKRGRVSNILQTFSHMNIDIDVDTSPIGSWNMKNFQQTLDMKSAKLTTSFKVDNKVEITNELMSLRNLPYTSMSIVTVKALKNVELTIGNKINSPDHLSDIRNYYSEIDRPHTLIPLQSSEALSPGGKKLATSTSFIFEEDHKNQPQVLHLEWDYNMHEMRFRKQLKAGQVYRFALVGSTLADVHNKDPRNEAERLTLFAKLEGIDKMQKAHNKAWAKLWEGDIVIDGDLESQKAIRSALYHLYSFVRAGSGYSMSPMGLSGLGYNGHVFWDTELWMYPPLLVLQPEIAKSILDYRFDRLKAAKENAFAHGFDGAMFPWESADDGSEETPLWALTGPFQQHISATIAWAFWKYYEVTGDKEWLEEKGYPVLLEVSKFWVSRVEENDKGEFVINNVIGANEFEENIDNNAFTNGMVKTVLEYSSLAAEELGKKADPQWRKIAAGIPILKFPDGTTRENATYNGQIIKQADVNLLSYPLKVITDKESIKRDLKYYEPRLDPNGPAMGGAILSVLYSRLGMPKEAFKAFEKSYKPNELAPFKVLAETAGGTNPYFATGAGGFLQAAIFGFGGLDIDDKEIKQLETELPRKWKSITIKGVGIEKKTFVNKK